MVGLDFSEADQSLIAYTAHLAGYLHPQEIRFVHVKPNFEMPDEMKKYLSEAEITLESIQSKMEELVSPFFPEKKVEIICEVYDDRSGFELWQEAHQRSVDLFFVGSKSKDYGQGRLAQKLVRKSTCSVCFVPSDYKLEISKILIPTDFSERSALAVETAVHVARYQADCQLVCLNVFELPHAYYYNEFPRQQYITLMEDKSRREYEQFISNIDTQNVSVNSVFRLLEFSYVAEHIQQEAENQQADLIIMSAGGQSVLSRLFLGSEAERIVQMEKNIPLLILKDQEKDANLWETITRE